MAGSTMAIEHLTTAKEAGQEDAARYLHRIQDCAVEWYTKAAEAGDADAINQLMKAA